MATTVQFLSVAATTDGSGYATVTFGDPIDAVMAAPNAPQTGAGSALVACSAEQTGAKTARVRCWRSEASPDSGSVLAAAHEAVNFTVLGLTRS